MWAASVASARPIWARTAVLNWPLAGMGAWSAPFVAFVVKPPPQRVNPALRNLDQLGLREPTPGSYRRTGGSPRGAHHRKKARGSHGAPRRLRRRRGDESIYRRGGAPPGTTATAATPTTKNNNSCGRRARRKSAAALTTRSRTTNLEAENNRLPGTFGSRELRELRRRRGDAGGTAAWAWTRTSSAVHMKARSPVPADLIREYVGYGQGVAVSYLSERARRSAAPLVLIPMLHILCPASGRPWRACPTFVRAPSTPHRQPRRS